MFLLPSLPFGSASGRKTQPLLHPSPADRDERGGLMQSSWPALRPAPLTRPPTHRNRSAAASSPALCGGSAGPAGTARGVLLQLLRLVPIPILSVCTPWASPVLPEDGHPLGSAASSLARCRRGWGVGKRSPSFGFCHG